MTPADFIKSLTPSFTRSKTLEDLAFAREEFENHVKPAYELFKKNFRGYKFQSSTVNAYRQKFDNTVQLKYTDNFIIAMWDKCLWSIEEKLVLAEEWLDIDGNGIDVVASSITARDITATQMAEILSFTTRFARRFLNIMVQFETNHLKGEQENHGLIKGDVEHLNKGYSAFLVALSFLVKDKREMVREFEEIPDVLVNAANVKEVAVVAGDKLDPFRFGFIPVKLNPIYHVGMRIAEYQAARYHEAQAEHQSLETKIMYLKKRAEGKEDARLESIIEKYDAALAKKTYEIVKMEEKYGLQ